MRRRDKAGGKAAKARPQKASRRRSASKPAHSKDVNLAQVIRERDEALEQQRATSEVLSVISSSVTDAQPVFEIIARSAARLCDARFCHVFRFDGKLIHFAATHGYQGEAIEALRRVYPIPPDGTAPLLVRSSMVPLNKFRTSRPIPTMRIVIQRRL